jgi:Fe-S-cluster containining protein
MPTFDCVRCGACCANSDTNRAADSADYVEVFRSDGLMRRRDLFSLYAVRNELGQVHLRLKPDQTCIALQGELGQSVSCTIYASRPSVCRRVIAGSEECLNARRERLG